LREAVLKRDQPSGNVGDDMDHCAGNEATRLVTKPALQPSGGELDEDHGPGAQINEEQCEVPDDKYLLNRTTATTDRSTRLGSARSNSKRSGALVAQPCVSTASVTSHVGEL